MLIGIVHQAVWLENETKVIFDFGYEGGARLYVADVRTGKTVPLTQMSEFKEGTEQTWAVSPDGLTLAIIGKNYHLWLVTLKDGKARAVEKSARNPYWSKDGKTLYYWWGPSFSDAGNLRAYSVVSGSFSTLVTQSTLAQAFNVSPSLGFDDFAISPSGDKILLWGDRLWLVELRK